MPRVSLVHGLQDTTTYHDEDIISFPNISPDILLRRVPLIQVSSGIAPILSIALRLASEGKINISDPHSERKPAHLTAPLIRDDHLILLLSRARPIVLNRLEQESV